MPFERIVYHWHNAEQGHQAMRTMWHVAKPWLLAGHRLRVTIELERRSLGQNDKFHAMCDDFARSDVQWMGKRRTSAEWKVLLVSGHSVATKQGAELVPGLEGEFVNIRESTARMSKARSSSLIEYTTAAAVRMGVALQEVEPA